MRRLWGFVRDALQAIRLVEVVPPALVVASDDPAHDEATCQVCVFVRQQPGMRADSVINHGAPAVNGPGAEHDFSVSGEILPRGGAL